jgi:amino-acid N-acetyltransferase
MAAIDRIYGHPMLAHLSRATHDDLPAILSLLAASQLTAEGLTDHVTTSFVARHDGAIVGTVTLEIYDDGALLRSLAVEPAARGRRIGHRLVHECIELGVRTGVPALYLLTISAERFFPRFGFERIARSDVPASLMRSAEFAYACPPSSIVMRRSLAPL